MKALRVSLAIVTATITVAASVVGLWHVATEKAGMDPLGALAVIAAFDVTAVAVGLRVAAEPRRWAAWVGLIAVATASAAAQILAAPESKGPWRWLHGLPAVAALWTFHGAVSDAAHREGGKPPATGGTARKASGSAQNGGRTTQKKERSTGAGREASGAAAVAASPPVALAGQPSHDASVVRLDDARRSGEPRASGRGAPPLTVGQMAGEVEARLNGAEPTTRAVEALCKAVDPAWTQKAAREVRAEIVARRARKTGTQ